uniref:Uncharacterized protein LOC116956628 isoform X2 n=1 Tax=Petromyzon marinus TaxID=7757 RepID=A0AAJ7UFH5_PETMA|nr:uncharacterized protein LOC116956628 isoform X2 [Petromyzon marinus]
MDHTDSAAAAHPRPSSPTSPVSAEQDAESALLSAPRSPTNDPVLSVSGHEEATIANLLHGVCTRVAVVVDISNISHRVIEKPWTYMENGAVEEAAAPSVPVGGRMLCCFRKRCYSFYGCFGILSYRIAGSSKRLHLVFSNPFFVHSIQLSMKIEEYGVDKEWLAGTLHVMYKSASEGRRSQFCKIFAGYNEAIVVDHDLRLQVTASIENKCRCVIRVALSSLP